MRLSRQIFYCCCVLYLLIYPRLAQRNFVDATQFLIAERGVLQRADIVEQLLRAGSADKHGGHVTVVQQPGERHFGKRLPAFGGKVVQVADLLQAFRDPEIDLILCAIGGDDTLGVANALRKLGVNVIGVPKTIDNDLSCTDYTFGFETASNIAMEAIDRLQTTAKAHSRCIVVECMGRHTGWIALQAGLAANAHLVLIPEFPKSYDEIISVVRRRYLRGDRYTIIVVAEGFELLGGDEIDLGTDAFGNKLLIHKNLAKNLSDMIEDTMRNDPLLGSDAQYFECRPVVLGHVQRGGAPCAFDRVLGTRLGIKAGELVVRRDYGKMVALNGNSIVGADLETAVTVRKEVDREFYEAASLYFK